MPRIFDFLLELMAEFAGGPGPPGNNLVRFGLAATLWFVLLLVAVSRQRQEGPLRERLLVVGFALALLREGFKFAHLSVRLLTGVDHNPFCAVIAPLEHALTLASVVVIAGAFLRYILDDARVAGAYLRAGLWISGIATAAALAWWPFELAARPQAQFHTTWPASLLHLLAAILIGAAVVILARRRGWLRNIVLVALSMLFVSEVLTFANFTTGHANNEVLCPLSNSFYLWAIPLFAFVYYREQTNEKQLADAALQDYRNHLEELVDERTAELTRTNQRLAVETQERMQTLEHAVALEERQRIAAEIHDGLVQMLGYLGLKTDEATSLLQSGKLDATETAMHQIRNAIGQATYEARRSISRLQDKPPAPQSLQNAIEQSTRSVLPGSTPRVVFANDLGEPLFVPRDVQEQVMRVVGEAMTNVHKHAQATHVLVCLTARQQAYGQEYQVSIVDDGRGFDLGSTCDGGHFGLSIMRARAERLGGQLIIDTHPQSGTRVELTWPAARPVQLERTLALS